MQHLKPASYQTFDASHMQHLRPNTANIQDQPDKASANMEYLSQIISNI